LINQVVDWEAKIAFVIARKGNGNPPSRS
jgi:hypothetical protein